MKYSTDESTAAVFRAAQVREMDDYAINRLQIPGIELMTRAGTAAFNLIRDRWPACGHITLFCGPGNNAGDAYVIARLARSSGIETGVIAVTSPQNLMGDAAKAYRQFEQGGGVVEKLESCSLDRTDLIVDGLLGTGLGRDVSGKFLIAIESINRFDGSVLALDIPSGLSSDTGVAMGNAVRADVTITFIASKCGMFTGDGHEYCGEIALSTLEVPAEVIASQKPPARLIQDSETILDKRHRSAHKGDFGHVLVIGGDAGFSGAARLAAEAAARSGAGLVSVATRRSHSGYMNMGRPELMCHSVENSAELKPLLNRASVVVIGPGLGQSSWAKELFATAHDSTLPIVIDADGLNLLANAPQHRENWILTPHPGEAARLLNVPNLAIQQDRFSAVEKIQRTFGGICLLKGSGTLIRAQREPTLICARGNPGMASGGFGDVLSGIIAGLLAQNLVPLEATKIAAYLHAVAADYAANSGERGMLASDLFIPLRTLVNR